MGPGSLRVFSVVLVSTRGARVTGVVDRRDPGTGQERGPGLGTPPPPPPSSPASPSSSSRLHRYQNYRNTISPHLDPYRMNL